MRKIVPSDAVLIPSYATKVFAGEIFSVYQWGQEMYDNTVKRFEMLQRPDSTLVLAIRDDHIVVLKDKQPGKNEFMTLPGGRVAHNEDAKQAAARIVTEETGLLFDTYRLVSVTQPDDKIEWFVYVYLATNYRETIEPQFDNGKKLSMAYMPFDEFYRFARLNHRMAPWLVGQFNSVESLVNAPTYQGVPLDSEV
jgi:ADP-ribose pyrophosphatase